MISIAEVLISAMPNSLKTLDDYQIVARDFLLADNFRCLFDEPGVGKTGPAIIAAWHQLQKDNMYDHGPHNSVLVTAPAYLLPNWEREIHDFLPEASVVRADGVGFESRREALSSRADFILTSYNNWSATHRQGSQAGLLQYPELTTYKWSAYIFDEGHRLRGRNSAWTRHVFGIRNSRSENRDTPLWILTGTPFVRDGGDFWTYFRLWNKEKFGSYWRFVNERCVVTETPWDKQVGNIRKAYAAEFSRELANFSLRRTVQEIPQLQDLEYRDTEYFVDLPKSVVTAIKKAKKTYVLEHPDLAHPEFFKGSGALYVAQRQLATVPPTKQNPKLDWLKDFLADKKGKVVVYVWYKDSARAVFDSLPVLDGQKNYLVTGDSSPQRRTSIVDDWKRDGKVLVATIPSLKEGISLTEARDVVFLEHSELPADQEQCVKRLCRRGQTDLVRVHHVWANKSVDMVIRKVLTYRDMGITEALKKWVQEDEADTWFT